MGGGHGHGRGFRGRSEKHRLREDPFVLLSQQLMPGSDILRGAGDSFGDIPICDSMTNLCLYLILAGVETALRLPAWQTKLLSARDSISQFLPSLAICTLGSMS